MSRLVEVRSFRRLFLSSTMTWETDDNGSVTYWEISRRGLLHGGHYKGNPHTDNASAYSVDQILKLKSKLGVWSLKSHLPPGVSLYEMIDIIIEDYPDQEKYKSRIQKLKRKKLEFMTLDEDIV